jgi:phage/plasmid-like protein (TIGR03299 family)
MFAVGKPTWHGTELLLSEAPDTAEGIRLAGLDWTVSTAPLFLGGGAEVSDYRAVVRDDTAEVLSIKSDGWEPVQNVESFSFFDPMIAGGFARLETAGSLKGGRKIWVLARIGSADVAGDQIDQFVLLANSHDGSLSVQIGLTTTRVVCNNTLAVAIGRGQKSLLRINHTKNVHRALDDAKAEYARISQVFAQNTEHYRALAASPLKSIEQLREYVSRVFEIKEKAAAKAAEKAAKKKASEDHFSALLQGPGYRPETEPARYAGAGPELDTDDGGRLMRRVLEQFESGEGQDTKAARGTFWGAYNGVTNFLTHCRGRTEDNRRESNWWGIGADTNKRALSVALDMI